MYVIVRVSPSLLFFYLSLNVFLTVFKFLNVNLIWRFSVYRGNGEEAGA